jgi:Barstar (barnase inhibitor)
VVCDYIGAMQSDAVGLPEFVFDGASFDDLAGFLAAITRTLGVTGWGKNLDAFNDILRGGFGTPDGGFALQWINSDVSAERLGWPETIRFIERKLTTCHPSSLPRVRADLEAARRGEGQTLFEIVVSIIREHGPGGAECQDNVHLRLAGADPGSGSRP